MKGECPIEEKIVPETIWKFPKQRNAYISMPADGGRLALPANQTIHFLLKEGQIRFADRTKLSMSGKLADFCRSFWINVDAEVRLIFDLEASAGVAISANGKTNITGLPFDQFSIRTPNVITNLSFIASIYPFPINIESIEHYEQDEIINNVLAAINANQIIVTFNAPVTAAFVIIGLAPARLAFDRAAVVGDPLIPPGAYTIPRRMTTIQAQSPFGLSTFNGWGFY